MTDERGSDESSIAGDAAVTDGAVADGAVTDGAVTDGAVTDGAVTDGADAGLSARLALIEDLPLEARAAAFAEVYTELQRTLEGRDRESADAPERAAGTLPADAARRHND